MPIVNWNHYTFELRETSPELYSMDRAAFAHVVVAGEYNRILESVPPGSTVFDCGANIGCFTILASACVGPRGKVVSIEPDQANLIQLRRNIELNRLTNVTVVDRPIWSEGDVSVSLSGEGVSVTVGPAGGDRIAKTTTLSEIVRELEIERIDGLKIDIEGSEVELFKSRGELEILSGVSCLVAEVHSEAAFDHLRKVLDLGGFSVAGPFYESSYLSRIMASLMRHPLLLLRLYRREALMVGIRVLRGSRNSCRQTNTDSTSVFAVFNIEARHLSSRDLNAGSH